MKVIRLFLSYFIFFLVKLNLKDRVRYLGVVKMLADELNGKDSISRVKFIFIGLRKLKLEYF